MKIGMRLECGTSGVRGLGRARRRSGLVRLVAQAARPRGRSLRAMEVTAGGGSGRSVLCVAT